MTTTELIPQFNQTILKTINIDFETNKVQSLVNENIRVFSPEEQKKINQALKEYENGECISDEEAQIELEKWFKEQEN